ncbi:T9SS type A sorting domain-containing protein [Chryseobacterium elymi]|uniref:T9SS type A sorting domain-containing protein n=1 Tax=Chryseobacterium elymi TaxID=395936 RepID=UPI0013004B15|nr:T9SS type A sorting domain-containing protein [Chryseobacterium elymi]
MVFVVLSIISNFLTAQEYRKLAVNNSAFQDVNDNGVAVSFGLIYNWSTNTYVVKEPIVYRLRGTNNNGDFIGSITSGGFRLPAYKLNGSTTWTTIPFPANTTTTSTFPESVPYQISDNGRYIAGQMGVFDQIANSNYVIPFVHDIQTGITTRASNNDFVNGTFYTVNNTGKVAGWVDIPTPSTRRVPTLFSETGVFKYITKNGNLPVSTSSEVRAINESGVAVGTFDNLPFIYDPASDSYTEFANPDPSIYAGGSFGGISNDGTVVGMWYKPANTNRYTIIYNPALGTVPIDFKTYLTNLGVTVNSTLDSMGAAYAISPNGKYIAGFEDGPAIVAYGWIVYLPTLVLANNEIKSESAVQFYPNPVIDDIHISLKTSKTGTANMQLYAMDGKLLKAENITLNKGSNKFTFNISNSVKGTKNAIVVIITPEGNRITKKIMLK